MNVLDVFPKLGDPPILVPVTLTHMLEQRNKTYTGFAMLESEKGFLKPTARFATSHGQEMIRILLMRYFEELTEALEAEGIDHVLEELIDAINYLWSLCVLDQTAPLDWSLRLATELNTEVHWGGDRPDVFEIGTLMVYATHLLSSLRNRAWQHNPQSLYFDGWTKLSDFVLTATNYAARAFESWEQFARFYEAKDQVLQFRLATKY